MSNMLDYLSVTAIAWIAVASLFLAAYFAWASYQMLQAIYWKLNTIIAQLANIIAREQLDDHGPR